ncbi:hypothetical protein CcrC1_gp066c [Caulobacter phage C1]|nr:hypothetical protein CcrC1_gp066c [Caulobacter phage C1]UTU08293.1 hypothetical protein CcrC2_gp065c [Caulobacter phage C2]UTU08816.1 hypothetical protein CcrJ4_gp065c [Caulobacter phage J4]UTU09368.1 hypothetical protein CcrBL47_gp082c [Caulobacter phage BL47]UTU09928.1 hypothetical protein CcrRB23_gp066c [Caulobacter phage RB23]WGN96953.1 hypothetical protein [Bertelyvirus sp.]
MSTCTVKLIIRDGEGDPVATVISGRWPTDLALSLKGGDYLKQVFVHGVDNLPAGRHLLHLISVIKVADDFDHPAAAALWHLEVFATLIGYDPEDEMCA